SSGGPIVPTCRTMAHHQDCSFRRQRFQQAMRRPPARNQLSQHSWFRPTTNTSDHCRRNSALCSSHVLSQRCHFVHTRRSHAPVTKVPSLVHTPCTFTRAVRGLSWGRALPFVLGSVWCPVSR